MPDPIILPSALEHIALTPLFSIQLTVDGVQKLGGDGVSQQVGLIAGGHFTGERLNGIVLPGASDWQTIQPDGTIHLDCRLVLQTDDGATIAMSYRGIRSVSPELQARMNAGEAVDPAGYYFRTTPCFYTSAPAYDWLNRILAVATGHRLPTGPVYNVFAVA